MAEQGKAKSEIIQHLAETGIDNLNAVSAQLMLGEVALAVVNDDVELQEQYTRFAQTTMDSLPMPEGRELSDEFIAGIMHGVTSILLASRDIRQRQVVKSAFGDMGYEAFKEQHLKTAHGRT